jgi:hypothetical protein
MKWRYDREHRRLNVFGSDCSLDLARVRSVIQRGLIPTNLTAIVYRTSKFNVLITGRNLRRWLSGETLSLTNG